MTDGVIQGYQGIQGEIDSTIDKKKGLAYFNAHEQEYQENLKKEAELQKTLTSTTADRDKAETQLLEKFKKTGIPPQYPPDDLISEIMDCIAYGTKLEFRNIVF